MVRSLRGMYAFVIYDSEQELLFLARDRFGKKPFFYFRSPEGGLVFASTLNALRRHTACPSIIDSHSIHLYLSLQYIPSPRSIMTGVFKLPPAHFLVWSAETGDRIQRYWDLSYEPKESLSYPEAKERLRHRLSESIRLRMIADVPLGAFLSGGIDSSGVVAAMARVSVRATGPITIDGDLSEEAWNSPSHGRSPSGIRPTTTNSSSSRISSMYCPISRGITRNPMPIRARFPPTTWRNKRASMSPWR